MKPTNLMCCLFLSFLFGIHQTNAQVVQTNDRFGKLVYTGQNAYDVANAAHLVTYPINTLELLDIAFNNDGTKFYTVGSGGISEYTLSIPYDVSSATFGASSRLGQFTRFNFSAMKFNPDGTQIFISVYDPGTSTSTHIRSYRLSIPFDITSHGRSSTGNVSTSGFKRTDGMEFSTDGLKLYVIGSDRYTGVQRLQYYTLQVPFSLSPYPTLDGYFRFGSAYFYNSIDFNDTGSQLNLLDSNSNEVHTYELTTPFEIPSNLSARRKSALDLDLSEYAPSSNFFHFDNGGRHFYVGNNVTKDVVRYTIEPDDYDENGTLDNGAIFDDGSPMRIDLKGDVFQDMDNDDILDLGTEIMLSNIPAGLTPVITLSNNDTSATLNFMDTATDHGDANDVSNIGVSFDDSAFTGNNAANISFSGNTIPYDSGVGIDFVEITADPTHANTTIEAISPVAANGVSASTVTVQLADADGNFLTTSGGLVTLRASGSALISNVTDNNDGTYTATVTDTVAERITIIGELDGVRITDTTKIIFSDDSDGDGVLDVTDLDDDNDGILDTDEGCGEGADLLSGAGSFAGPVHDDSISAPWYKVSGSPDTNDFDMPTTFSNDGNPTSSWTTEPSLEPITDSFDGGFWVSTNTASEKFRIQVSGLRPNSEHTLVWEQTNYGVKGTDENSSGSRGGGLFGKGSPVLKQTNSGAQETDNTFNHSSGGVLWRFYVYEHLGGGVLGNFVAAVSGSAMDPKTAWGFERGVFATSNATDYIIEIGTNAFSWMESYTSIDGIKLFESCPDQDGDGVPNSLDLDSDNDGIYDVVEAGGTDTDNNGRHDDDNGNVDNTFTNGVPSGANLGTGIADPTETTEGTFDFLNLDSDGDGCSDANEAYRSASADSGDSGVFGIDPTNASTIVDPNTGLVNAAGYKTGAVVDVTTVGPDLDTDGVPNMCDNDVDGDGVSNIDEDINNDDDPSNDDSDNDGTPDYLDVDDDGDGVATINEDIDNDGDPMNDDSDNDGTPDYLDLMDNSPDTGSIIISATGPVLADGISTSTVTVTLADFNGNLLERSGGTMTLDTTGNAIINDVTDNGNGTYTATVTNTIAETVVITGTLNGDTMVDYAEIEFIKTRVDPLNMNTTIDATGPVIADGISISTVTVTLVDFNGNLWGRSGGTLTLVTTGNAIISDVTDNGNGTYTATVTNIIIETVTITATINGNAISDYSDIKFIQSKVVQVKEEVIVYNAITPNGDGQNDFLTITNLENSSNTLEIYNRWGIRVYETQDYGSSDNFFTGMSAARLTINTGEGLPTGTYYYILKYQFSNQGAKVKTGYIFLKK